MLKNPVFLSVIIMIVLALMKTNILLSLIVAALAGGSISGMGLAETMNLLISGMGGNAETALSYVLLGALAAAIRRTGAADILALKIGKAIKGKKYLLLFLISGIASLSQNLIPVHIAFIPILIPPLLGLMNDLEMDRRAVACSLTFGLKAPYLTLPVGFGLLFHETITNSINETGLLNIKVTDIWKPMSLAGIAMIIGLLIAIFISYRKPREYKNLEISDKTSEELKLNKKHIGALFGAGTAFLLQIITKSLPIGAIGGLLVMLIFKSIKWVEMNEIIDEGIDIMGFIAFVMLVAAGYSKVIREMPNGIDTLVISAVNIMGGRKLIAAIIIVAMGLIITMGIGSSFATVPILSAIFVPISVEMGFSTSAIIAMIGIASAVGDAGSPASDSTLGPTSGLNADGQHDHISDTVIPTFIHFSIPLMIAAVIGGMIL